MPAARAACQRHGPACRWHGPACPRHGSRGWPFDGALDSPTIPATARSTDPTDPTWPSSTTQLRGLSDIRVIAGSDQKIGGPRASAGSSSSSGRRRGRRARVGRPGVHAIPAGPRPPAAPLVYGARLGVHVTPTDAAAQRLGVQETVYATAIVHETRACLRRGRRIIGGVVEPAVGEVVGSSAGSSSALSAGSSDYRVVGVAVERAVGVVVGSSVGR